MYTNKHNPHYTDFGKVCSNTEPGLSYSVAELLARTVRGERLPGFAPSHEVDDAPVVDWLNPDVAAKEMNAVTEQMDKDARNPQFQADFDEIDAHLYLHPEND